MENFKDYFEEIYGYVPAYFIRSDKESITVRIQDNNNQRRDKVVTIKDVVCYLNRYWHGSQDNVRILGDISGERNTITSLAMGCYEYFKLVNLSVLKETAKENKLELNIQEM